MWATLASNTTAVGAFEFRSEESGSLGTNTDPSTGRGGAQVKIQGVHVGAATKAGEFYSVGHDGQDCVWNVGQHLKYQYLNQMESKCIVIKLYIQQYWRQNERTFTFYQLVTVKMGIFDVWMFWFFSLYITYDI